CLPDSLGWEVCKTDRNVHSRDDELHSFGESLGIERVIVLQEFKQVEACQVAGGIIKTHVLRARIRCGDATSLWVGVPVINRVVVLNSWICAGPSRFANLVIQGASVNFFNDRTISA